MLYKIDSDFYIKVSGYFVKVELVYTDNDISLKPTDEKIECNKNIAYNEINFLSIKDKLLSDHNKSVKHEFNEERKFSNKKYSR